jgi:predicted GTPase
VLITGMSGAGKSSLLDELAETLEYQQTVEPPLRASATLEVITTILVGRVADIVLDHVG